MFALGLAVVRPKRPRKKPKAKPVRKLRFVLFFAQPISSMKELSAFPEA
jgi:hypothetical protein